MHVKPKNLKTRPARWQTVPEMLLLTTLLAGGCGSDSPNANPPSEQPVGQPVTDSDASPGPADESPVISPSVTGTTALGPLPSPPLSAPPSNDDEPTVQDTRLHTSTAMPILEDAATLPAPPPPIGISEAEFSAGPLAPVVLAPPGVDLDENQPPYFENLDNITVLAGQLLELNLAPIDPDGGVADQYVATFLPRSRSVDNDDATKTIFWTPFEADVGIRDFTIFALDAENPELRVAYTIRIKVEMPSDPSTIENTPPTINHIDPYTVRVGDPVVLEITATDPNDTVPTIEISNLPPAATLLPHRDIPSVHVLRFVPEVAGQIALEVIARDALEPTLRAEDIFIIDVEAPARFTHEGGRLRELADARDFLIGFAASPNYYHRADGALYADTAAAEFNLVTAENSLKWDYVNPYPGDYRWADPDNLVAWAKANDLALHGHTLVWYAQLPPWVLDTPVASREGHMREHIDRVLSRYRDDIKLWDVVNEAIDEDGSYRPSVWYEAMGPDYVDIAFRQARASAPDATLIYNEYDTEVKGPKADALFALIDDLQANGTPLDGIGFQMHLFTDFVAFDDLAANMAEVASRDLDIYVTELDVSLRDSDDLAEQVAIYEGVLSVCLLQPRCKALQTWGFTDRHSWRRQFDPLILGRDYQPKPAYLAIQRRLGEN